MSAASLELASTPARQPVVLVSTIGLELMLSVEALLRGRLPLAVYALSFWHYLLYGLAFCIGAVPLRELKRDALATKAVALTALGIAYLGAPVDAVSVTVVGGGFLLNALGARSLGPDRTYYGRELAALPLRRVTSFPYSWMSHPMLVGNMAAFAGTLLNADFRRRWWPLASAHVGLNLGLLLMEQSVTPRLRAQLRGLAASAVAVALRAPIATAIFVAAAGAASSSALGWAGSQTPSPGDLVVSAVVGAGIAGNAALAFFCYSPPAPAQRGRRPMP